MSQIEHPPITETGLYRSRFEHDNCGFGLIAHMRGQPSHWLVQTAIQALGRLTHRGAIAADGKTGDGCGLLIKKPDSFFRQIAKQLNINLNPIYAVGAVFLNTDSSLAQHAKIVLEQNLSAQGLEPAGWRDVPIDPSACGKEALKSLPQIAQIFVNAPPGMTDITFERKCFVARRLSEIALKNSDPVFYVASLSAQVISYKGLVMPDYLSQFYQDLGSPELETSICIFHQRFSTNTWPQWKLAQPFRFLAHNGEINTIQGNRNWAMARAHTFKARDLPDLSALQPLVSMEGSDSCSMDNMLEVLLAGGMDIFRSMRLLIPPAWQNIYSMDAELRAFYEFSSMHMEPWDGPAGVVLTDGRYAACVMDRNGLRPARYVITNDGHITLASEIGVYDYSPEIVVSKGRLSPGQMLAIDTDTGKILSSDDIDERLRNRHPYLEWLQKYSCNVESTLDKEPLVEQPFSTAQLLQYEKMFGVTFEERDQVLRVLAEAGQEAVGSMGDDTPLPVLSRIVRSVFDNFRQQFAQVTNPPIDPLRESIVMSLETCLGRERNMFEETAHHAARLLIDSPVLSENKFKQLLNFDNNQFKHASINLNVPHSISFKESIEGICNQAVTAARDGAVILVLTDRHISKDKLPIHAALACGAVHHRLITEGLRCNVNLLIETATARDAHQFAVLIGYGATAIYPYLAYESLNGLLMRKEIAEHTSPALARSYRQGINKGLKKIMSKMGISTIASYRGAQLFEIVGLHEEVVDLCFTGTTSRISGATFAELKDDQEQLANMAWNARINTHQGGLLKYIHGGEYHAYNPDVVQHLQSAVKSGNYDEYKKFADLVNHRPPTVLRDLLDLDTSRATSISIEEVEPIEEITLRFDSAGMSLGALSPQAHETLAQAMNRMGGRSNSGEGGEDPARFGTDKVSKIKQVASGRFGVTPHYLVNAEVIQIKIAQGAKPGEGGQLPGHKVNKMIAELRYSNPGVSLISPPPHHDIYSIEDLAQLIFDLKQINPQALVSVKLVAEAGVGTIAAGVAKAYADLITISGYDGGTGASPLTSIKYAGGPWELGLTETHATLRANDLRDKVRLQTDGGLKTGLDVIKAAILGAESFGFGTAPMIAMGCKYLRICHLNNCATGVATQDNVLRLKYFIGQVEMVTNYFKFVAQETREWMATLGVRKLTDLIGRTELLKILPGNSERQHRMDLTALLDKSGIDESKPQFCTEPKNRPYDKGELAEQMVRDTIQAVETQSGGIFKYAIQNTHRSIGARLSGEIAKRFGNYGMSANPITLELEGTAGQSFGVWNAGGLHLRLRGDANDYVGKGMAAGQIVIYPPENSRFKSNETTIMGNTCLYGATGGKLFAAGLAGERFAVRNSGAIAVVEGIGDHGCEYMTGGVVVVLGQTGINFGAGMTGGFSFVLDHQNTFMDRFNRELVEAFRISPEEMEAHRNYLRALLGEFVEETQSEWGQTIFEQFDNYVPNFWLVKPKATELNSLLDSLKRAA